MKTPLVLYAVLASGTCQGYQWSNELEPPTSECVPYRTRCVERSAEICVGTMGNTRWREHTNCAAATPYTSNWQCCQDEYGESVCLPQATCTEVRAHRDAGVPQ